MGNKGRHRKDTKVDRVRVRSTLGLATLAVVGGGALAPSAQAAEGTSAPVSQPDGAQQAPETAQSQQPVNAPGNPASDDGQAATVSEIRPGKFGTGGAVGALGEGVDFGSKEFIEAVRKDQENYAEGTPEYKQADQLSHELNNNQGHPYAGGDLPVTQESLERACGTMTVPETGCRFDITNTQSAPPVDEVIKKADGSVNNSEKERPYKYTKTEGVTTTKGWEISASAKIGGDIPGAPATPTTPEGTKTAIEAGVTAKYGESTATSTTEATEHTFQIPPKSEAQLIRRQPRVQVDGNLVLQFAEPFRGQTEYSVPTQRTMNDPNSGPQVVMQTRPVGSQEPWSVG
ncbi:ETX/MTX2 family pore-forming toxin [Streptomyces kronopolitis]|uniref:ETX/MTX2 family pore-forming toxin n=1 Tax=Streptomyces kronopolitis TaxID=1612435 RepID=UPI0036A571E6